MKVSIKKTTVLSLCVVLGLTIGISSAFGQKMTQPQVKGEMPIDQPEDIPKKQLVPEHLKPKKQEQDTNQQSQVKGEKPVDIPDKSQKKRLAPENNHVQNEQSKVEKKQQPKTEQQQSEPEQKQDDKQHNTDQVGTEKSESKQEQPQPEKEEKPKPEPDKQEPSQKQTEEKSTEQQPDSQSKKEPENPSNKQQPNEQPNNSNHENKPTEEQSETEIEIPQMEVETENGEKVDVTSVIEDVFGNVNNSKEETQKIQEKMENETLIAGNDPVKQEKKELTNEPVYHENTPRTIKNGKMPMTASNDLQGVLFGLLIACAGGLFVFFRKGESQ